MLRILQYTGGMNRGGLETLLINLHKNIYRDKLQFDYLIIPEEKQDYEDEIYSLGGKCIRTHIKGKHYLHCLKFSRFLNELFIHHPEYKIVHGHEALYTNIVLRAARKHGRITIAHSHNTKDPIITPKILGQRIFMYPVRFAADYYFACSRQAGIDSYGHKVNAKVFPNSIYTENFRFSGDIRAKIRKASGTGINSFVIGHAGRFERQKNHKFLIEIFRQVHKIIPDSRLWLIGRGPLVQDVREQVHSSGLDDAVDFIGIVSNVNEYLMGMDAFVFPSVFEGLGIALIEAEASGLPCFVSEAIQDEAVVSDRVARLSLKDSPRAWAERIAESRNCANRELYADVVRDTGFDIKQIAQKLQEFYLSLA